MFRDLEGRRLRLDVVQYSQIFRLVNVYLPNDPHAREEFIKALHCHLSGTMILILSGDFIFIEKSTFDKQGGNLGWGSGKTLTRYKILSTIFSISIFTDIYNRTRGVSITQLVWRQHRSAAD